MIKTAAIISDFTLDYPSNLPYNPNINYPEYLFGELSNEKNDVYAGIRQLLIQLGMDRENYSQSNWNPLNSIIKPGNSVVIKPNWVNHYNPIEDQITGLITHSSVIRAILDYVLIALNGKGEIIIGDAPIQSCNFDSLIDKSRIIEIVKFLQSKTTVKINIRDFRKEKMISKHGTFIRISNPESRNISVNLKRSSFLNEINEDFKKFRVTSYDKNKMLKHHNNQDHTYLIAEEVLRADTIIEIPKLKTHRKAGITCCLKNNVGINAVKDCLVHHRKGSIDEGGDAYIKRNLVKKIKENLNEQYDRTDNTFIQLFYKMILKLNNIIFTTKKNQAFSEGNWYGNDTVWRMIHDLNRIVFYADSFGIIKNKQQRHVLYLVDGIIGGEGEGPLEPKSVNSGILALGIDPLLIDSCMSSLIGFDNNKIPSVIKALNNELLGYGIYELLNFKVKINGYEIPIEKIGTFCKFLPALGWKNHIEK